MNTQPQEMEIWNKDKLLLWIQEKKPELFADEDLETFKAAHISGKAFLNHAGDLGFFKRCNLPMWTSWHLADLAEETKKSKHYLSYYGRNSDSQLTVARGQRTSWPSRAVRDWPPKKP